MVWGRSWCPVLLELSLWTSWLDSLLCSPLGIVGLCSGRSWARWFWGVGRTLLLFFGSELKGEIGPVQLCIRYWGCSCELWGCFCRSQCAGFRLGVCPICWSLGWWEGPTLHYYAIQLVKLLIEMFWSKFWQVCLCLKTLYFRKLFCRFEILNGQIKISRQCNI